MKKILGGLGIAAIAVLLMAQTNIPNTVGFGGSPSTAFATSISQCPTLTNGYFVCIVVPAGAQPFMALSVGGFNGGAPFPVVTQQSTGVASFAGRTGAVLPANGDYSYSQISGTPAPPTAFQCTSGSISSSGGTSGSGCTFK